MGSIAGIGYRTPKILGEEEHRHAKTVGEMLLRLRHRGEPSGKRVVNPWCALGGSQDGTPQWIEFGGSPLAIVFDGDIFNQKEIKKILKGEGYHVKDGTKEELVAGLYRVFGDSFLTHVNGTFALVLWDGLRKRLILSRDRIGAVPLFYAECGEGVVFASEIKGLFAHPKVKAKVDIDGLRQIFGIGPGRISGSGVFHGIYEVKPAECVVLEEAGLSAFSYWKIPAERISDSYGEAVEKVRFFLSDAILRQTETDLPICSLLSGGIDSSIVTAMTQEIKESKGQTLATYSFAFEGAEEHFTPNAFQGSLDTPYVGMMADALKTKHTYLVCEEAALLPLLDDAMQARDLPGMADVDASLLYFLKQIAPHHRMAMTGECADEVFGGYPWFYREDLLLVKGFPWTKDLTPRLRYLHDSMAKQLELPAYVDGVYQNALREVPYLEGETPIETRRREVGYLSLRWFMRTLLDRMDRMGMRAGVGARVPFADYRLMEYVFNLPWEMKRREGVEKSLLREAMGYLLPTPVRERKKSPYPKTYKPAYEEAVRRELLSVLSDPNAPLSQFVDRKKVEETVTSPDTYGSPWYGQLMALPQLWAYYLQINRWLAIYAPEICWG